MPHRAAFAGLLFAATGGGLPWFVGLFAFELLSFQVDGITASIGAMAAGFATAYGVYLKAYEGSFKQQLDRANLRIDDNERKIGDLEQENKGLKAENDLLRRKLAERDEAIALRDRAIQDRDKAVALRDRTIDENARLFAQLGADTADLAEAFLIRKGDAKPRTRT